MRDIRDKALEMASKQRAISIAEFFEKNRHLLGFDNPKKALLTVVKEAVDNALDACEEAGILPEIIVEIYETSPGKYLVVVEDNGPGIVREQIPHIFARLLYGSKFHKLSQSRGQQGIGISAAVLYAQLTTGKPARITSRVKGMEAHYFELMIETKTNTPKILVDEKVEWEKEHGTRIELEIEGSYVKGLQSVDEYIKQTAIVNPHATIIYVTPKAEQFILSRATDQLPKPVKEIKPHPYGVELGRLLEMLHSAREKTLKSFLMNNFSRVGEDTAKAILENALLSPDMDPRKTTREDAERLIKGINKTKIMAPPTDCISPIGEELLEKGLRKEIEAEFYTAITRTPQVYRGNPFVVEVGIAYGGNIPREGNARVLRFANRVPLLYQQGACAITSAVTSVNWKSYGLQQPGNGLPIGPLVIAVHIASVWVPFTSESKEAIAHYPEIIQEIRLALQEAGRRLSRYIKKKVRISEEIKKRSYIEKYIPHIAGSIVEILELPETERELLELKLKELLEKKRGKIVEEKHVGGEKLDEDLEKLKKSIVEGEEHEERRGEE